MLRVLAELREEALELRASGVAGELRDRNLTLRVRSQKLPLLVLGQRDLPPLTLPLPLGAVLVEGVAPTICAIFRLGLRGAFLFVPGVHLALDSDQPRQNSASLQDFLAALEWRKATAGGWGAARKLAWRTW